MKKYLLSALSLVAAASISSVAQADDNSFSLHLEPGLAVPLSSPQSDIYNPGMVLGTKGMFALTPNFAVGPAISALYLPRTLDDGQNAGTLWQFGGSARLQGDRRAGHGDVSPWVDVDVAAAATGNLVRPAVDVGIGLEAPLDSVNEAWMGPFLRYTHAFQTADTQDRSLLDSRDVNIFQAGFSFSFDFPPKTTVVEHTIVQTLISVKHEKAVCPPPVKESVAPPEKFDLSEKVYFDHDSSVLRWESKNKLNAVVAKLNAHPTLTTEVDGYASAEGQAAHNVALSAKRTQSVVAYLVAHGVDAKRLSTHNFGPVGSSSTKEERERNRRVEFVVNFVSR